ncbi:MAG: hypothetical protein ACLUG4_03740 [Bacilli bacterium]
MGKTVIYQKMRELEVIIHYHFNDIAWLSKAMRSEKIEVSGEGKNHSEYTNDGLATIGDTGVEIRYCRLSLSERNNYKRRNYADKSKLENNEIMHNIMLKCGLIGYAYNAKHFQSDAGVPDHEKVVNKGHDPYIEAIVGAVFYDSNYDTTKRWILKWLLPLLINESECGIN